MFSKGWLTANRTFMNAYKPTNTVLKWRKKIDIVNGVRRNLSTKTSQTSPMINKPETANRLARIELAGAYRILDEMGLSEGICNHLTSMTPAKNGDGEVMLLIPFGMHWREVTASSLVGVDKKGNIIEGQGDIDISASCIHRGIREISATKCIFHIHPPYTTALACLDDPEVKFCHQTALRFKDQISYDRHFGGAVDSLTEGKRLGKVLGGKPLLMMGNHGVLSAAPTPGQAMDLLYYLERMCMFQVLAMSTGKELSIMKNKEDFKYKEYIELLNGYAELHFSSRLRLLQKSHPDFAD